MKRAPARIGIVVAIAGLGLTILPAVTHAAAATTFSIKVSGKGLVNGAGKAVQLRGVNHDGEEYACAQGWGVSDGPLDQADVTAVKSWHDNAVRLLMNEDCWLGINGFNPSYSGAPYRQAIENYVSLLTADHIYTVLDLSDVAPGFQQATGTNQMPDASHAPTFWKSVAAKFKGNPAVIFDLFGEPYPLNNGGGDAAWQCWLHGGKAPCQLTYNAAGMQTLVNAVRSTGASNVLLLDGIGYGSVLGNTNTSVGPGGWKTYKPTDPDHNLAAGIHVYDFGGCTSSTCWNANLVNAGNAPIITGEMGFDDLVPAYVAWANAQLPQVSYLAWTWNSGGYTCSGNQALISDYTDYAPCSPYGTDYQSELAAAAG